MLERQKIAAEMKDLDQPSRAGLRKYGVRFGAYHIYFPALLKPAARSLASLLWAQKQDNVDLSALSSAQHLAGSGRTSFPADKLLDRDAYRVLGYRQCGERAVRVDILERLADLIRPALSWREGVARRKARRRIRWPRVRCDPGHDVARRHRRRGFRLHPACARLSHGAASGAATSWRRADPATDATAETVSAEVGAPESAPQESAAPDAMPEGAGSSTCAGIARLRRYRTAEPATAGGYRFIGSYRCGDRSGDLIVVEETAPSAALLPDIAFSPASDADETASADATPG